MIEWKIIKKWKTKSGLQAIAIMSITGNINGYVKIPKSNQFYNMEYNVWNVSLEKYEDWTPLKIKKQRYINDIEVHGGLTYGRLVETDDYLPKGYWFGFDTAHAGDSRNFDESMKYFGNTEEDIKEVNKISDIYKDSLMFPGDTYKDLNYVINECESLAAQLNTKKIKKKT